MSITQIFAKNKNLTVTIDLVLILFIGYLDYFSGYKLGFAFFYLLPICLVAWYVNLEYGVLMAGLAMLIWILVEYITSPETVTFFILFWNAMVQFSFFLIVAMLVSRLHKSLEIEKRLARIDFLTGIANRHEMYDMLFLEMERARRNERPLTLAYMDCDNFKRVNDDLGHEQGDLLLREVANVLNQNIRKVDQAARMGGDEFIVLLTETSEDQAKEILLRIHVKLLTIMELYQWPVTFSMGAVTFYDIPLNTKDAIAQADQLMHCAKQSGKNQLATKTIHSFITKS